MDAAPRMRRNSRVLVTLAEFYEANIVEPDRALVAACSGYQRPTQPGFRATLTALRQAHHVTYPTGNTLRITELGRAQVTGPIDAPTDNDDVHNRIAAELTVAQRKLFRELLDGRERKRLEVAAALGYPSDKTPGFRALLTQLSNRSLLTLTSTTTFQLSDVAFPFSRGL